ncbi:MAG: CPBP family glutamic-type intramembrane protease [Bacteroidota bacterium]
MNRQPIGKFLLFFVFVSMVSFVEAQPVPKPHDEYKRLLGTAREVKYEEYLAIYDRYLEQNHEDVKMHIERCKFIEKAFYSDYDEYNPKQDEFDVAYLKLLIEFGHEPLVIFYRSEHLWGTEAINLLDSINQMIDLEPKVWLEIDRWKIYKRLAELNSYQENAELALQNAELAILANDTLNLDYLRANQLKKLGRNEEAIAILVTGMDSTEVTWKINSRAQLLLELEDYENALKAYKWASRDTTSWQNNEDIATAFLRNGLVQEARTFLLKDTTQSWNKSGPIRRLYDYDLKYSEDTLAYASYQRLRDLGYEYDPVGFLRASLIFKSPFLPIKWRDMLGLGVLLAFLLAAVILPYFWISPIYFSQKVLKPKAQSLQVLSYKWTLRDFWKISSLYLLVSFMALFIFEYNLVISWFTDDIDGSTVVSPLVGARETLFFIIAFGVSSFFFIQRSTLKSLIIGDWDIRKSLGKALVSFLMLRVVAGITITIFGVSEGGTSFALSIEESIVAMINGYGAPLTFLLIVIFVPFYEEVVFRGIILTSCNRYVNFGIANTIQAALFGVVHDNINLFIFYFIFGLTTGWLTRQSMSLTTGMFVHAMNNGLVVFAILLRM